MTAADLHDNAPESIAGNEERKKSAEINSEVVQHPMDLERTFRFMMYRRWRRQCNGHYEKKSKWKWFWPFLLIVLFLLLAGVLSFENSTRERIVDKVIISLFILCLAVIIAKVTVRYRWSLYWIALTALILFFLNPSVSDRTSVDSPTAIVLICFLALELLTFAVYLFLWTIYPIWIRDASWLNIRKWWNITWCSKSNRYRYQVLDAIMWLPVHRHFSYSGELHPESHRPHGYGVWSDTSITGERYSGYFDDGIPVGPSKSIEVGSGHGFAAIRIGCISASEDGWGNPSYIPKSREDGELAFAVASSECSVSGKFYIELPQAKLLTEIKPKSQLKDPIEFILEKLNVEKKGDQGQTPDRSELSIGWSKSNSEWKIDGYIPNSSPENHENRSASQLTIHRDSDGTLNVKDWTPLHSEPTYEALIFLPGFNCSLQYATQNLSQMLTLGEYPHYIKPFVFSWPSGRIATYHAALRICESEKVCSDFVDFLRELEASKKFRGVHVIAHSMGARLFLSSCGQFSRVFNTNSFRLLNILFMNPEANLCQFVNHHYEQLKNYCDLITIYGNENDGALGPAEWFSRQKMLGFYTTSTLCAKMNNPIRSLAGVLSDEHVGQHQQTEVTVMLPLDLDLIDTTYLDANVHEVKHSYFSLNRSMVDDMRELIIRRERAKDRRSRLVHIDGNVYTFLNAPSYVVNR